MSNLLNYAEKELELISKINTDPENRPIIEPFKKELLALLDKIGNSGQSGSSIGYTISSICDCIKKLGLYKPLTPVLGGEDEFSGIQNNRCTSILKNEIGAYYLDAIVWKTQTGSTWCGVAKLKSGEVVYSRQYVRFPFTPKTFYINVREEEVEKDNWEFYIDDEEQLKEVFEYYDKFTPILEQEKS